MGTPAIGSRRARVLAMLMVQHPTPVRGVVLGEVAAPNASVTHQRRGLEEMIGLGVISARYPRGVDAGALQARYQITQAGVDALRQWAFANGSILRAVFG